MRIQDNFSVTDITQYYHYEHQNSYFFDGHRHHHCECNAVLSGEMEITCDENVYHLYAGDFILLPPHSFHRNHVTGTGCAQMIVLHFISEGLLLDGKAYAAAMTPEQRQLMALLCADMEIRQGFANGSCPSVAPSARKLLEVFLSYSSDVSNARQVRCDERSEVYYTAVRFMGSNLEANITLSDIARACNVSRSTLKSIFSRYTGMGCMAFFAQLRLERAKQLLEAGMRCSEVSSRLGFSSQAYFSKRFKEFYGLLPSAVRKQKR